MAKKGKLWKFAELNTFKNVYQNIDYTSPMVINHEGNEITLKGKWAKEHFKNDHPVILELACGKGDYARALAKQYENFNFIGLDLKGNRLWKGAKTALEEEIQNVAFLRTRIELIENYFDEGEIDQIWITFPDPFLRKSKAKKRLTSTRFLPYYRKLLKKDGIVHLKTDDPTLYEFTLETLTEEKSRILYHNNDIYKEDLVFPELQHKTFYEQMHLENKKTIKYIRFIP